MSYCQHNYSKFDQGKFLADFNNLNFEYLNNNQSDVNGKFNRFLDDLNKIIRKHAPLKKLSKRDLRLRNKPWINSRIQKMMLLRDKYLKQFRKKSDPATIILYKKFRNRVANEVKESKTNYVHNYFNDNSKNMKLLWTGIKSILGVQNSQVNVINKLKDANGNLTSDSATIATLQ